MAGIHEKPAQSDVWLTPQQVILATGPYDLDPCAAPSPRPWPTAKIHVELPQDGLKLDWTGKRVWCNPPYSNVGPWLRKLADHGYGTALVMARTDVEWFFRYAWARCEAALFLRGRLNFCRPDGTPRDNAPAPSVLLAYGERDAEALMTSGLDGHLCPISPVAMVFIAHQSFGEPTVSPWREVVSDALRSLGGEASLTELYKRIADHPKARGRAHWREKVRQTVRATKGIIQVGKAQYALAV